MIRAFLKTMTEQEKKAFDYAIRILSIKDYSVYKMKQKLTDRKHSFEEIQTTINRLIELNYLREDEYKRIRIKTLLVKNYSDNYILQKCAEEMLSINQDDINQIRSEYEIFDDDTINKLIEKKLRNKEIPKGYEDKMKLKAKLYNFLFTKGYSQDCIQKAVSNYI